MPDLIAPAARLHAAWLDAHAEWGPGQHEDGFGLAPTDEVTTPDGFAAWLARLARQSDPATTPDAGHRCTYRWIVEDDRVLGGIALRDGSDDYVSWAGHIGYGIRPSARGRGLATWALGRMRGVCGSGHGGSARTVGRGGGGFEGIRDDGHGPLRHYRIDLAG